MADLTGRYARYTFTYTLMQQYTIAFDFSILSSYTPVFFVWIFRADGKRENRKQNQKVQLGMLFCFDSASRLAKIMSLDRKYVTRFCRAGFSLVH